MLWVFEHNLNLGRTQKRNEYINICIYIYFKFVFLSRHLEQQEPGNRPTNFFYLNLYFGDLFQNLRYGITTNCVV